MNILECNPQENIKQWNIHPQQICNTANYLLANMQEAKHSSYTIHQAWKGFYNAWKDVIHARPENRGWCLYLYIKKVERATKVQAKADTTIARSIVATTVWHHLCSEIEPVEQCYDTTYLYYDDKKKWELWTKTN